MRVARISGCCFENTVGLSVKQSECIFFREEFAAKIVCKQTVEFHDRNNIAACECVPSFLG